MPSSYRYKVSYESTEGNRLRMALARQPIHRNGPCFSCFGIVARRSAAYYAGSKVNSMARFSERIGVTLPKTVLQVDSMDDDLRNGLWNIYYTFALQALDINRHLSLIKDPPRKQLIKAVWADHFKQPLDQFHRNGRQAVDQIRTLYFRGDWAAAYDLVDFVAQHIGEAFEYRPAEMEAAFVGFLNQVLEREMSGYRFVGNQLTPITHAEEIAALDSALKLPTDPVRAHVEAAVALLSDRKSPDYRNSIKESISAVEAMCQIITGDEKANLGQALKKLEARGIPLHAALRNSFSSLYGYTNDAEGIRHALLEESTLDFEDAKFMLVSCSAFVNYLAAKAAKAGVATAGK